MPAKIKKSNNFQKLLKNQMKKKSPYSKKKEILKYLKNEMKQMSKSVLYDLTLPPPPKSILPHGWKAFWSQSEDSYYFIDENRKKTFYLPNETRLYWSKRGQSFFFADKDGNVTWDTPKWNLPKLNQNRRVFDLSDDLDKLLRI